MGPHCRDRVYPVRARTEKGMLQSLTNSQKFLEDISLEDYNIFGWMMEYLRYLKCLENDITKGPLVKNKLTKSLRNLVFTLSLTEQAILFT